MARRIHGCNANPPGPGQALSQPEGRRFLWAKWGSGSTGRSMQRPSKRPQQLSARRRILIAAIWLVSSCGRMLKNPRTAGGVRGESRKAYSSPIFQLLCGAQSRRRTSVPHRTPQPTSAANDPRCVLGPRACPARILNAASRRRALRAAACAASRAEAAAAIPATGNCLQRLAHELRHNQNFDHGDVPRSELK